MRKASRYLARVASTTSGGSSGPGGAVMRGGPEAGGIRREGFVDPDQFIVKQSKFEFCIGKDDPARFRISRGALVYIQADGSDFFGKRIADEIGRAVERDRKS